VGIAEDTGSVEGGGYKALSSLLPRNNTKIPGEWSFIAMDSMDYGMCTMTIALLSGPLSST